MNTDGTCILGSTGRLYDTDPYVPGTEKEGTPCFMLESVENKISGEDYSFIGINPKSESRFQEKN